MEHEASCKEAKVDEVEVPEYEDHTVTIRGGNGIVSQEDFVSYFEVIGDAFAVHMGREKIRRGLWKDYPAKDQFNQIKIKIDRIMRTLEIIETTTDQKLAETLRAEIESESSDIINYATFGVRQL
jgi:hypothetical protein